MTCLRRCAGACHLPDPFSPTSTPASTRDGGHPDDDLDFFSTNIGIVQNYPSDSATEAGGSDSEDEGVAAAVVVEDRSAAYVMSLEQENESLKQINLNLQEVSITTAAYTMPAQALTCHERFLPECMLPDPSKQQCLINSLCAASVKAYLRCDAGNIAGIGLAAPPSLSFKGELM